MADRADEVNVRKDCGNSIHSAWIRCCLASAPGSLLGMQPYERFPAWVFGDRLAHAVYELTEKLPRTEIYGVKSQVSRAAFSIPANIVEGSAKRGCREFGWFLDIAIGSIAEFGYGLRFARDRGWISFDEWKPVEDLREHSSKLLWRLYREVRPREA